MLRTLSALLLLFIFHWHLPAVRYGAQASEFKDLSVSYTFDKEIVFHALIAPVPEAGEVTLFIQPEGEKTRFEKVPLDPSGLVNYTYDAARYILPAFIQIHYWLVLDIPGETAVESQHLAFNYDDNRFTWEEIEENGITVYWSEGEPAFGRAALDVAARGMEKALGYVKTEPPDQIRIYIYPGQSELLEALPSDTEPWTAGHAIPESGTALVSISPGENQVRDMERQIPHEITHILFYQAAGSAYRRLPAWLTEGTASLTELYPDPDQERLLKEAALSGRLANLTEYCDGFPPILQDAALAYAQSASFTGYLYSYYGSSGLSSLVKEYAAGVGCTQGVENALGIPFNEMEAQWRKTLVPSETKDATPLFVYALLFLILIMLPVLAPILVALIVKKRKEA